MILMVVLYHIYAMLAVICGPPSRGAIQNRGAATGHMLNEPVDMSSQGWIMSMRANGEACCLYIFIFPEPVEWIIEID